MGLFDEIKRSLEEAINEAQGNPPPQRRRPTQQRPRPPQQVLKQPVPVPFEDDLETAQSRDHQQRVSQRKQQLRQDAQKEQRAKEEAKRKEMARRQQAAKRARAQEAARQRQLEQQRRKSAAEHALKSETIRHLLQDPNQFKQAVVLTEILGKPLAKRERNSRRIF